MLKKWLTQKLFMGSDWHESTTACVYIDGSRGCMWCRGFRYPRSVVAYGKSELCPDSRYILGGFTMSLIQLVLGFLVLGSACGLAIDDHPPIFRWGYEVASFKGYGKPGRAY